MTTPYSLTTDPEYSRVDVMAPYAEEPETAYVGDDGVVRDDGGSTFDRRTYWIVAESEVIDA